MAHIVKLELIGSRADLLALFHYLKLINSVNTHVLFPQSELELVRIATHSRTTQYQGAIIYETERWDECLSWIAISKAYPTIVFKFQHILQLSKE